MNITKLVFVILQEVQHIQSQHPPTLPPPSQTFWNGPASNWFVAAGTLVLAFVAVFQEWIKSWFFKPTLNLRIRATRPYAEKTSFNGNSDVYYFRVQVTNSGRKAAEDVQVFASSVKRKKADNKYESVDRFTPMALKWTHKGVATLNYLLPKMPPAYCDLGHITDPARKIAPPFEGLDDVRPEETVFVLETEVNPNSKGNLFGPGEYHIYLTVAASNCEPREFKLTLKLPGKWFPDEARMYRDGIGIVLD